jgi:hypothetical protein
LSTDNKTLFRSTDGGVTFAEVESPNWTATATANWSTGWSMAEHDGTIMIVEYGAASALQGRLLQISTDDGATWTAAFDLETLTPDPYHFHTVGYHAGQDRWIAAYGDGLGQRGVIYSDDDGTTWAELSTPGDYGEQPVSFYDYGDSTKFLAGFDGGATVGTFDVTTGDCEVLFADTDHRANKMYCWSVTKVDDVYYAGSFDSSSSAHAVLWVSSDLTNWSVYHRFAEGATNGFYRYVGYLNGKLHYDVSGRRHFSISPAAVKNVTGTRVEPAITNLASAVQSSSETGLAWASGSLNWTASNDTTTGYHGSRSDKFVGTDADAATKQSYLALTLGDAAADKYYVASVYAKASKNVTAMLSLRTAAGAYISEAQNTYYTLSTDWQRLVTGVYTISAGAPATYRVYVSAFQGVEAATIWLDGLQVQELPLTSWQVGGTAKAADSYTETFTATGAWTDIFAIQTTGLSHLYGVDAAIKTWAYGADDSISLGWNESESKFTITRTVDGTPQAAVSSAATFWHPNAVIKFALRVSGGGIQLSIQNGGAVETLTDSAVPNLVSNEITATYNAFPGVVVTGWNYAQISPLWVNDTDIATIFDLGTASGWTVGGGKRTFTSGTGTITLGE